MKSAPYVFLQAVIVVIAIVAISLLIYLPTIEGRATNLDLISIYTDPFILFGYVASIPFFVALYKAFQLLSQIVHRELFTMSALTLLRGIRYCVLMLAALIISAALFIKNNHHPADDPAGFLSLCTIGTLLALVAASILWVLEKGLEKAISMKSENDLTI